MLKPATTRVLFIATALIVTTGAAMAAMPAKAGAEPLWQGPVLAVSQRGAVQPWQRGRERSAGGGTFIAPLARPQTDLRPSDYYVPPPRHPQPFYHYYPHTPTPAAPAHQRQTHQLWR